MFIAAMGRIFNIHDPSCFDIIEKLAEMNEISEYAKQNQMYAVALACKMRIRWFMKNKSQSDIVKATSENQSAVKEFFSVLGTPDTVSYFQIAYALQCDISKRLHLKKLHFHSNPQLLNFSISVCLMDTKQGENFISRSEIEKTKFKRLRSFDECLQFLKQNLISSDITIERNVESDKPRLFLNLYKNWRHSSIVGLF